MVSLLDEQVGIKHWIVVFVSLDKNASFYWWQLFTGRKWGHVWMMGLSDCGYVVINPRGHHFYIEHFWSSLDPYTFISAASVGQEVVGAIEVSKPVGILWKPNIQPFYSCVSIVKDILNIRKLFVFTPKQLHDHLLTVGTKIEFTLHRNPDFGIIEQKEGER
jgi:hypothetical protein